MPNECCRSWSHVPNRTILTANSSDSILWSPNQSPFRPRLHRSIKIMNRTVTKGRIQQVSGAIMTYCWQRKPNSCSGHKDNRQLLTQCHKLHTPRATSTEWRTQSNTFSMSTKKHVDWTGKLQQTIEHPSEGIELVSVPWPGWKPHYPSQICGSSISRILLSNTLA